MVIDFSKVKTSSAVDTALEPRKIFTSLPEKDSKYNYPRDVQTQVMEKWFERREDKDLVIKMNTGAGKTVVGLLILKSCLNEKKGPSVYIVPDKYLTHQVLAEAKKLGISVTENEHESSFLSGKTILVINIAKLFNGKSTFGVGSEGEKIKIGSLLIDDAHSCIAIIKEKFSLKLPSSHDIFSTMLKIFKDDLTKQSPSNYLDIEANDPNVIMQIPFWSWKDKQQLALKCLHKFRLEDELMFVWPLIKEILPFCQCTFTGSTLEISPRLLPTDIIPSFANAKRRIYMTATLADDSVLVANLLADPKTIAKTITPNSGDDLGDRMILAPQELTPTISEDEIKAYLEKQSKKINVVIIVPSAKRAEFWNDVADQTLFSKNLVAGVKKIQAGLVGITVLVNKYDGIDLPDDACRILVIDGVPEFQSPSEKIDQSILEGSEDFIRRQVQKIEQGIGRGVRSNEDYCAIILLGAKLTSLVHTPLAMESFTPATRSQFELSRQIAEQLKSKPMKELGKAIDLCLKRNHDWVSTSKGALVSIKPVEKSTYDVGCEDLRKAFDAARINQFPKSVELVQKAIDKVSDAKTIGFLKLQKAEYTHHFNSAEAQKILLSAVNDNRRIIKPLAGIAYNKLTVSTQSQIALVVSYAQNFPKANDYIIHVNSVLEDLIYQVETSEAFESAVYKLGLLLGFQSQRPEKDYDNKGPDNIWSIGDLNYFVIECKNGAETSTISKSDCDQLSGAMHWFGERYDSSCRPIPVMFHHSNKIHNLASAEPNMKVCTQAKLDEFKHAIRTFAAGMTADWSKLKDEKHIQQLLNANNLTHNLILQKYFTGFKK